eukprot:jgi/Ulvmu1/3129/UM015_0169.1
MIPVSFPRFCVIAVKKRPYTVAGDAPGEAEPLVECHADELVDIPEACQDAPGHMDVQETAPECGDVVQHLSDGGQDMPLEGMSQGEDVKAPPFAQGSVGEPRLQQLYEASHQDLSESLPEVEKQQSNDSGPPLAATVMSIDSQQAGASPDAGEPGPGALSDSVPDPLIQSGSKSGSVPASPEDGAESVENSERRDAAAADENNKIVCASPAKAGSVDRAAEVSTGAGKSCANPVRKRTRAQARAEQAHSGEAAGAHVPGESAKENHLSCGEGGNDAAEVPAHSSEVNVPSTSHEDRPDVSSRRTRASVCAAAGNAVVQEGPARQIRARAPLSSVSKEEDREGPARRTRARASLSSVSEQEDSEGPARRTRARASLSIDPEEEEEMKFPAQAKAPRTRRTRRGRAEKADSTVSVEPSPSSGGRSLRPRTRGNGVISIATTSEDTGNASDAENDAAENVGTSALREAEADEGNDDTQPPKFVATLSPIPENKTVKPKGKQVAKRNRGAKDVSEGSQDVPRRTTRRVTRSQDTS